MNKRSVLCALILMVPSVFFAAPNRSILVLGNSSRVENGKTIYTSSVSLIFKDPSETIKVTADEITFEQNGVNLLRCSGESVIESGGPAIKGKDLTFEFDATNATIYVLNSNGIVMGSAATVNTGGFYASTLLNGAVEAKPISSGASPADGILKQVMRELKAGDLESKAGKILPPPAPFNSPSDTSKLRR